MVGGIPAEAAISGLSEAASHPVIGWKQTTTQHKKSKTVVTTQSVEVRAWELAALAGVGLAGLYLLSDEYNLDLSVAPGVELPWWLSIGPLGLI